MTDPKSLASLLAELPSARLVRGDGSTAISGIEHDSRRIGPGGLFVAIPGFNTDGHNYLGAVAGAGATAVLVQEDHRAAWEALPPPVAVVAVPATRPALSAAAAWHYGHPARELVVIGITGTDGKTTTGHMTTSVLEASGAKAGRLGTVDVYIAGRTGKGTDRMSTPEASEVQRLLREMVDAGCDFAVVESTSHGLALNRLDHAEYDMAVFTNITGDHLDFHETFEAYREAKAGLFSALDRAYHKGVQKFAIANADDPSSEFMLSHTKAERIRFGMESRDAEVLARNVVLRADGSAFRLVTPAGMAEVEIALPALFNVSNALAAASAGVAAGVEIEAIRHGLATLSGVPGRMERIACGQPFDVIVDYAHTGEAVRKVLEVLREVCRGKLIVVVGAAGERDPGRRFAVGRAAALGADFSVFTNEDPRTEDPAAIVREIASHAEGAGRRSGLEFAEVVDRREAIAAALGRAAPGDVVAILGKGHEQSIVYGNELLPWDDRSVTREELARLGFTGD